MPGLTPRLRLITFIIACAFFMQNMDATIITTALPHIAASFGAEPVHLSISISAYLLTSAVFMPVSGWLADRYGSKTIFRTAIVLFTLGSVACGLSNSVLELTLARVLQGVGGSMLIP